MGKDASENDFERELRDFLLTAFADGEQVTGEWQVETDPEMMPNWRVTVERTDAGAHAAERATETARPSKTD